MEIPKQLTTALLLALVGCPLIRAEEHSMAFESVGGLVSLVTVPPDFHRFVVAAVAGHSPAAEVEVRRGDMLLAIDGKRATNLSLSQIREMLELPDREYSLSIERDGQRLTVHLKTRQLI